VIDRNVGTARRLLREACDRKIFPSASVEIGGSDGVLWREAMGTLSFEAGAAAVSLDTWFDLASLTKPVATTTVILALVATHRLALDDRVAGHVPDWRGRDREEVTIVDLLEHASGLPARLLDSPPASRREFEHDIGQTPLEYRPRTQSVYSDLGFILLGFIAADLAGVPLDEAFGGIVDAVSTRERDLDHNIRFQPRRQADGVLIAPTEALSDDHRKGRRLVGEVHDSYAACLGGVAGHAGLFGTAGALGAFARVVLNALRGHRVSPVPFSPEMMATALRLSSVPDSSRALGWDTMRPTSSCGTRMSAEAFGHTGFTGTSLWIDPVRDRYFVLLTNRVCGGGTTEEMQQLRRSFHDALGEV
jgi:CubicO group peptidase (beta-lactamase class C family)